MFYSGAEFGTTAVKSLDLQECSNSVMIAAVNSTSSTLVTLSLFNIEIQRPWESKTQLQQLHSVFSLTADCQTLKALHLV